MLQATSPAVSSSPLWNLTPCLSLNVQVRPSSDTSQLSAKCGSTPPSVLGKTSESYRLASEDVLEKSEPTAGSM